MCFLLSCCLPAPLLAFCWSSSRSICLSLLRCYCAGFLFDRISYLPSRSVPAVSIAVSRTHVCRGVRVFLFSCSSFSLSSFVFFFFDGCTQRRTKKSFLSCALTRL